jgi:tRNA(fMet)-specific endonuclease VapC
MRFLLDTNTLIALFNDRSTALVTHLKSHHPIEVVVSSIVMHELYYGAYKSQRVTSNLQRLDALPFEVIAFDKEDAIFAGDIRAQLALAGLPIGPLDTLIAGQAKARGFTLVSNNTQEFSRVEGLNLVDWLR